MGSVDATLLQTPRYLRTAFICARQLPRLDSISLARSIPKGRALSGIVSPRTPSTHSTSKPVSAAVRASASRLSVRSGKLTTKILEKPSDVLAALLAPAAAGPPGGAGAGGRAGGAAPPAAA